MNNINRGYNFIFNRINLKNNNYNTYFYYYKCGRGVSKYPPKM